MIRLEIKKFFRLLESGKSAYPSLIKFLDEVDKLILKIIQAILTFFGFTFDDSTAKKTKRINVFLTEKATVFFDVFSTNTEFAFLSPHISF